uniref:Cytochrome P450 4461J4 n=1 Tax=Maconellicoccus hirsutus TaxID=177089 RepID=A0AAT9UU89_MACHI
MGPKPILVLKKFDDISIFLNQNSERNLTKISKHWAGEAILNNKHVEWKKSRKLINPAFSSQMIEKYFDVFNKRSFALVDKLKLYADTGKEVDIHKYLLNSNIEGLIENLTGAPIRTSEKEVDDFGVALKDVLHGVARGITSPWLYSDTIYSVYLKLTGNMKLIKELNYLPAKIVRENLKDANEKYRSETADSSKCLIDLMVKAQQKDSTFTETRLEHEFLQLMSAGTDASALNASFTLLMLAIHQDVQQKVYEEITQLVGEHDAFTSDHLSNHLKYLEQCIRETLRMYDPVAVTIRESQKEHVLKDNTIIPAGMYILIMIHLANNDSAMYENPHKWNPENFSEQAIAGRPKRSQLSFSVGPRSCPASNYAILSIKLQIAQIIRHYHVSTCIKELKPDDLKMEIGIRSKLGYPIRLTLRKKTRT